MSWISLLILLAVVTAGYLGWVLAPVYIDQFAAKQATRDFMNRAVKSRSDSTLVNGLSAALARIGRQKVTDEAGAEWDVPVVDVPPEAITWERDTTSEPPTLHVFFEYDRTIVFPILDRESVLHFTVDLENDLTIPKWD
jgi:hypothetical protein